MAKNMGMRDDVFLLQFLELKTELNHLFFFDVGVFGGQRYHFLRTAKGERKKLTDTL